MTYICPACGGPNENHAGTRLINCIWCGTAFRIPTVIPTVSTASQNTEEKPSPAASQASLSASQSASAGAAAAASSTAMASSIIQAAQDPNLANDPEKAAEIAAAASRAAENAIAAANAASAAAAAAAAAFDLQQKEASLQAQAAVPPAPPTAAQTQTGIPAPAPAAQTRTDIPAPAPAQSAPQTPGIRMVTRKFADAQTGITLASATIPENFNVSGSLVQKWQSDMVPFTASIQAVSPDRSIFLSSTSGEFYSYYLNPLLRSAAASVPGAFKTQLRNFIEPDEYLHQYAGKMAGVRLTPTARAKLPSPFGMNLQGERNRLANYVQNHMINVSVQTAVSTYYCDAFLYRYEASVKGRRTVFLAGCDYKGVEYYDASNSMAFALGGGAGGLLAMGLQGGLFGQGSRSKKAKAAAEAAAAGRGKDSPTGIGTEGIPFGHGKEYGKRVDTIDWGCDRLYFMAAPIESEKAATSLFLRFIGSLTPDPALWKRRELLIEQMHQQRIEEAVRLNAQATQMRMEAQRRQAELSRQIQANSEEISRGIMDSWEKRSASQSRISENWSQATRGVNTWQTSSGRTVEASVTADHVYQNRYGDTIEVSGTALDDELTSRLDWTELKRK
ncbi:MAG: hypothetical protein IJH81_02295 [Lachnospiraceae bacterium]|nr:hypothetical protein [Lachnospiraceae bacterium]